MKIYGDARRYKLEQFYEDGFIKTLNKDVFRSFNLILVVHFEVMLQFFEQIL